MKGIKKSFKNDRKGLDNFKYIKKWEQKMYGRKKLEKEQNLDKQDNKLTKVTRI